MKKTVIFLLLVTAGLRVWSQTEEEQAPYKKFSGFPPVKLLLADSVNWFSKEDLPKKKSVMLMLFNPTCEHCRHETEELIANIDKFAAVQVVMATSMSFDSMRVFRERFRLEQYENITVGYDPHFFLLSYFMIHQLPVLAFYDKKKQFITVNEGSMPIDKALEILNK